MTMHRPPARFCFLPPMYSYYDLRQGFALTLAQGTGSLRYANTSGHTFRHPHGRSTYLDDRTHSKFIYIYIKLEGDIVPLCGFETGRILGLRFMK